MARVHMEISLAQTPQTQTFEFFVASVQTLKFMLHYLYRFLAKVYL